MTSKVCTVLCKGNGPELAGDHPIEFVSNRENRESPCWAYQELLKDATEDILIYVHDDVIVTDPRWLEHVMWQFSINNLTNPDCVAVGLGGATSLGRPDLYRKAYNIWNMARGDYASNQVDAEVHGSRFTGVRRVAVLDAFFMAVRADFLRSVGGWPVGRIGHHGLDLWLACEAARAGKEIWTVGCECQHLGGRTSLTYQNAPWLKGRTPDQEHAETHRWLYDNYRDVLPIRIRP